MRPHATRRRAAAPLLASAIAIGLAVASPARSAPAGPALVPPAVPPCRAAALSLSLDGENGAFDATSHGGTLLVLRNLSPNACSVPGLPTLSFAGPSGRPLPIERRPPPGMHPGPVVMPVAIAAGAEATSPLRWVSGQVFAHTTCQSPTRLSVRIGDAPVSAPFHGHLCGEAGRAIAFDQPPLRLDPTLSGTSCPGAP